MSVQQQVQEFIALGFSGQDVRHIAVYVQPALTVRDGQLAQTHEAYVGESRGNFMVDFPTRFIFACMTSDWVFEEFELAGKTWPGIAVLPADADFNIHFGDPARRSVVVEDKCQDFFTYRYQFALRNTQTGELVVVDPGMTNGDRPDGDGGDGNGG